MICCKTSVSNFICLFSAAVSFSRLPELRPYIFLGKHSPSEDMQVQTVYSDLSSLTASTFLCLFSAAVSFSRLPELRPCIFLGMHSPSEDMQVLHLLSILPLVCLVLNFSLAFLST